MKYCSVCKRHRCCGPAETRTVPVEFKCPGQPDVDIQQMMMIRTCKCYRQKECPFVSFVWHFPFTNGPPNKSLLPIPYQLRWKGVSILFHEEPETSISILISITVIDSSAPGLLCYALSTAGTSTATCHSRAFNLLKFDHTPKKESQILRNS